MHEILIDIVHAIIHDDVPHPSRLVPPKSLFFVQERLVNFVMELLVLVFMREERAEDDGSRLRPVYDFEDDHEDAEPAERK